MQVTQEFVGRHLDGWIAQYFSCSEDRNKYTLGEFLAEWLPQVGNTYYALQWIANGGKNSEKAASPELRETDPEPTIQLNDVCKCGDNRLQHASKYPYDHEFELKVKVPESL